MASVVGVNYAFPQEEPALENVKLNYFKLPARAEATRLLLTLGGIEFENNAFSGEEWRATEKKRMAWGKVPVLELGNTQFMQSHAINMYIAAKIGLLPENPFDRLKGDTAVFQFEDSFKPIYATFSLSAEEKIAARQKLMAPGGAVYQGLERFCTLLEGAKFLVEDRLTVYDVMIFVGISGFVGGFLDGIPPTCLDVFPILKEYFNFISSSEGIQLYYKDCDENDAQRVAMRDGI